MNGNAIHPRQEAVDDHGIEPQGACLVEAADSIGRPFDLKTRGRSIQQIFPLPSRFPLRRHGGDIAIPSVAKACLPNQLLKRRLAAVRRQSGVRMQEVPIVAVIAIVPIVGIDSIEAMQAETSMTTIADTATGKAVHVVAHDTGMNTSANTTDMIANSDASNMSAAKPADMTHTATDVRTTAKSTDVGAAAEAATHAARVAAAAETTAAARLCLRSKQARRQQDSCQNGYHLSHHVLHSVIEWCAPVRNVAQHQSF